MTFTTATLCASFILFSGFNTTDTVNTLSLLSGFLVTFTGVYLLNLSRGDPNGAKAMGRHGPGDATGTDMVSSLQTRMSMEARRSLGRLSMGSGRGDREGLIRAYDEEDAVGFGLTDLAEDSDEGNDPRSPMMGGNAQQQQQGRANGTPTTNGGGHRLSSKKHQEQTGTQSRKSDER